MSYPASLQGPTEMQGRHFGFLAILCATWVTARIGILTVVNSTAAQPSAQRVQPEVATALLAAAPWHVSTINDCCVYMPDKLQSRTVPPHPTRAALMAFMVAPAINETKVKTGSASSYTGAEIWNANPLPALADGTRVSPDKLRVYAYSFWRSASQGASLTSGGQYGGGQSGFIATYDIARFGRNDVPKFAFLARAAIAHDDLRERELAAGLRWWPQAKGGFSVTAERRFRHGRPDAFSAYIAGGKSDIALPLKFRLDSYGQAGFVSGDGGGPFFDAAARAERPLAMIAQTPIAGGIGIWAGGQEDLLRVDIGPTIRANLDIGKVPLRLHADWRFRIAGDARPASGPALTLSTAF
jgi:hypothetical protein